MGTAVVYVILPIGRHRQADQGIPRRRNPPVQLAGVAAAERDEGVVGADAEDETLLEFAVLHSLNRCTLTS